MSNTRTCIALMTLTLAVTPLVPFGDSQALAGGRGGGGGTSLRAFGLPHTAMGGATLALDTAGRLVVSNIGSSGQDGVSVDLGHTTGCEMQCDIGTSGALPLGSRTALRTHFETGDIPSQMQLYLQESNGGQCDVLLDYTGTAAACVHVELFLDYQKVGDIRLVHPPGTPPGFALAIGSGDVGGASSGGNVDFHWKVEEGEKACSIFRPSAGEWSFAMTGQAPVLCDQITIALEGLPPNPCVATQCDLLAANPNGGTVTVAGEAIKIKHKGWDGLIYGSHRSRAVGESHITGVAAADICAGCYECCHPENGDALSISSGVQMSNIGSSGQDGVAFSRTSGTAAAMEVQMGPPDFSNPLAALELRATATFSDMSSRDTSCTVSNAPIPGALSVAADFSSLASVEAIVDVLNGNTVIGSVVVPNPAAGTPLAMVVDLDGLGVQLVRSSTIPGDALAGQPGYGLYFGQEELLMVSGQGFVGNEIRVRANDSTLSVVEVEELACRGKHFRQAILTCRSVPATTSIPPVSVVHDGLVHTALGATTMVMRDSDGDGLDDLQLHNIGSSGQDGVSIDLRQSQGGAVSFAGNGVHAGNFTQMRFEVIDEVCPTCPSSALASAEVVSTGPSSAAVLYGHRGCCRGHVTLLKRGGSALAGGGTSGPLYSFSFPFIDNEPWPISAAPGSTLALLYQEWRWVSRPAGAGGVGGVGDDELQIRIGLAQDSGGGTLSGVTVSHPLHGTFTNVEEIVVSQCFDTDAGMIDESRMLFTAAPGCLDCTVAIEESSLALHRHQHHATGEARLVSEDCDDADPDFAPELWVANIGSSGQDGVEIKLPAHKRERACDETDPLPDVIGGSAIFRPSQGEWLHRSFEMRGSLVGDDDDDGPLDSVTLETTAPNFRTCTCTPGWHASTVVRATVRDQLGNVVLDVTGLPPGPMCSIEGGDDAGTYSGGFTVTVSGSLAGGSPHVVEASTQTLEWPSDVIFVFGGQAPVVGRSLELHVTPSSGSGTVADFRLNEMRFGGQSPPGTTRAMGISSESVTRMPPTPPCPADIAPYATNGDNAVNVTDLLAVISGWGTCASCPATPCAADVNTDCLVNVTDLLAVISQWGSCL